MTQSAVEGINTKKPKYGSDSGSGASSDFDSDSESDSNCAYNLSRERAELTSLLPSVVPRHWSVLVTISIVLLCAGLLPVSQQTKQKFCGPILNEAMDTVCVNGYNGKISSSVIQNVERKRQANDFFGSQVDESEVYDDMKETPFRFNNYALQPFLAGVNANFMANGRRRRDGGIYDECCRKPCSYGELKAYCRNSK